MSDEPGPSPDDARESDVTVEQEAAPEEISADGVARVAIAPDDNGETYTSYGLGIAVHNAETEAEALRQHADAIEEHAAPGPNDKGYISGPRAPRSTPSPADRDTSTGGQQRQRDIHTTRLIEGCLVVAGVLIGLGLAGVIQ